MRYTQAVIVRAIARFLPPEMLKRLQVPEALEKAAVEIFITKAEDGFAARIIREALQEIRSTGHIEYGTMGSE